QEQVTVESRRRGEGGHPGSVRGVKSRGRGILLQEPGCDGTRGRRRPAIRQPILFRVERGPKAEIFKRARDEQAARQQRPTDRNTWLRFLVTAARESAGVFGEAVGVEDLVFRVVISQ